MSLNESFDTKTAFGRAVLGILAIFAQFERELVRERTRMGLIERAKQGLPHGGNTLTIGYDLVEGMLVENEYESMIVREIFDLFLEKDLSIHSISKVLTEKGYGHSKGTGNYKYSGKWNDATIKNILQRKTYIGKISYDENVVDGQHDPIIDKERFELAQKKLEKITWKKGSNKDQARPFQSIYPLSGITKCAICGLTYNKKKLGQKGYKRDYYVCRRKSKKKTDITCTNKNFKKEELEGIVFNQIKNWSLAEHIKEDKEPKQNASHLLQKELNEIETKIEKLFELFESDNVPMDMLNKRIDKLTIQRNKLYEELQVQKENKRQELPLSEVQDIVETSQEILDNGTNEEKKKLIHKLIDKIIVENDKVDIVWKF